MYKNRHLKKCAVFNELELRKVYEENTSHPFLLTAAQTIPPYTQR